MRLFPKKQTDCDVLAREVAKLRQEIAALSMAVTDLATQVARAR